MLIEKYTATWIKDFENLKSEFEKRLHGLDFSIEHIGSTSVPKLDSKPIIDIDIIYIKKTEFEKIKAELLKTGYYHNGNQGIKDREVFKRKGEVPNEILDKIKHHLYVCPVESEALERHVLSRNFLRNNDWARLKYQQMKYKLAEQANHDRKKYAELKEKNVNDFIDSIVEKEKKRTRNSGLV